MKAVPDPISDGPFSGGAILGSIVGYLLILFQTVGNVSMANIAEYLQLVR